MPPWLASLLWVLLGVVIGAIVGFFLAREYFKKQIEKNPPINEKMIPRGIAVLYVWKITC